MRSSEDFGLNLDIGAVGSQFFGLNFNLQSAEEVDLLLGGGLKGPLTARKMVLLSAAEHELRHFHDFLLSPAATLAFFDRIHLGALSLSLFRALLATGNAWPVPLTSWYRLSPERRAEFLAEVAGMRSAAGLPALMVPPIPHGSTRREMVRARSERVSFDAPEELISYLVPILVEYRNRVDYVWSGGVELGADLRLMPPHVFEASSILVQLRYCRDTWGADAAELLLMLFNEPGSKYRASNYLNDVFKAGLSRLPEAEGERIAALLSTYCIAHDIESSSYGSILKRHLVLSGLARSTRPSPHASGHEIFDAWDTQMADFERSAAPVLPSLRSSLDVIEDDIGKRVVAIEALGLSESLMAPLRDFAKSYADARRLVVQYVLSDPEGYAVPASYLHVLNQLPQPLVRIGGKAGREMAIDPGMRDGVGSHDFSIGLLRGERFDGPQLFNRNSVRSVEFILKVGDELAGVTQNDLGGGSSTLEEILPDELTFLNVRAEGTESPISTFEDGDVRFGRYDGG